MYFITAKDPFLFIVFDNNKKFVDIEIKYLIGTELMKN